MRKLYEKKEILFAVLWIVAYCVILGTIRGNFGDESIYMLLALLVFTAGIIAFVKANHLEGKYGLAGWPKDMKNDGMFTGRQYYPMYHSALYDRCPFVVRCG